MDDDFTTAESLEELTDGLEDFWATLNDDRTLDEDTKADITRHMETAEYSIKSAKKVISDLPESD